MAITATEPPRPTRRKIPYGINLSPAVAEMAETILKREGYEYLSEWVEDKVREEHRKLDQRTEAPSLTTPERS